MADGFVSDDFEGLYHRELATTVRLAHLLTGSNAAADDIAHEAFLKVRDRWESIVNPGAYLRVVAVNLCRNWHRSNRRRVAREQRAASVPRTGADDPAIDVELLDLVDRLPFRQRTVLVARYWLDLPEAEIAELVGCRPGTVKSLASRGLDSLRKDLS
ncbi:RNA polymerase sigma factor (sigma-70 family) [Ilumatobacter fluminis]|uniref:RNA polymerase sigma factor (Sigma-70 family) n=1 Tax=Ilumatobacter fluminis TaxID=467091 RepID=A0A4R7HVD3_9ACTN|nr:sigma-70 family RNA polymerase sigma factor [Ilumatobacter fluminis]TDT14785.1 RNA polymerase sigma factor (sigma-70 family) [Ilumatobacter fluminis]